jgi:hypothetical protein
MADREQLAPVTMYGVRLIFRNFRGEEDTFNDPGERTFAVLLDEQTAQAMAVDDWNVKYLKPRDEEEEQHPQAFLPVRARWDKGQPPTIYLITGDPDAPPDSPEGLQRRKLDEDEVEMLDWAELINVDMIVKPSRWTNRAGTKTGIKAYLRTMYVTIQLDDLARKYDGVPERR